MDRGVRVLALAMLVVMAAVPVTAASDPCSSLGVDTAWRLADGDLYVDGEGGWEKVERNSPGVTEPQTLNFIYIARETFSRDRTGVIVIKTGRGIDSQRSEPPGRNVRLVRDEAAHRDGACDIREFQSQSVSSQSYDEYHDHGFIVAEQETFDSFHTTYRKSDACRQTNDANADVLLPRFLGGDGRSNRSQFSFDESVVDRGMFSQIVSLLRPRSAFAWEGLSDQRVEIIRYAIEGDEKLVCIPFSVNATGPHFFLRINDLEARDPPRFARRGKERSWTLLD